MLDVRTVSDFDLPIRYVAHSTSPEAMKAAQWMEKWLIVSGGSLASAIGILIFQAIFLEPGDVMYRAASVGAVVLAAVSLLVGITWPVFRLQLATYRRSGLALIMKEKDRNTYVDLVKETGTAFDNDELFFFIQSCADKSERAIWIVNYRLRHCLQILDHVVQVAEEKAAEDAMIWTLLAPCRGLKKSAVGA